MSRGCQAGEHAPGRMVYVPSMITVLATLLLTAAAADGHIGEEPAPIPAQTEPEATATTPDAAAPVPAAPHPEAQAPAAPVIPLTTATRTKRVSSSTVRVSRAQRARRVRAARAKSLPAGEKRMVGWDGIEPPTPGFSVLGPSPCKHS